MGALLLGVQRESRVVGLLLVFILFLFLPDTEGIMGSSGVECVLDLSGPWPVPAS